MESLPAAFSFRSPVMITAACYLLLVAITSLWAFLAYWLDKRLAQSESRRISESNLLFIAFLGGWPGAFAAQRVFRHKTRKVSFQTAFRKAVVAHYCGVVGCVACLIWGRPEFLDTVVAFIRDVVRWL